MCKNKKLENGRWESVICQKPFCVKYLYFSVILQQHFLNLDLIFNINLRQPMLFFICAKGIHVGFSS